MELKHKKKKQIFYETFLIPGHLFRENHFHGVVSPPRPPVAYKHSYSYSVYRLVLCGWGLWSDRVYITLSQPYTADPFT